MKVEDGLDRAAMIEAASRSLRQQMRGALRPASKSALHDGAEEPRSAENAQRRIRSAENQHRSASSHCELGSSTVAPTPSTSALDNYLEDDVEEDVTGNSGLDDVPRVPHDFPQELKRPASRKKDPSASAAAGLGAFSGPARMTDAFEQRKTRQPIPVESWGPRPPSRAGLPPKAAESMERGNDGVLGSSTQGAVRGAAASSSSGRPMLSRGESSQGNSRPSSKMSNEARAKSSAEQANLQGSKVVGGTWASARVKPRVAARVVISGGASGSAPASDARRGRERRNTRGGPEAADLGVFGRGQPGLTKSLSGVLDTTQFRNAAPKARPVLAEPPAALEVSGCGLGDAWPASPQSCSGTPPTRRTDRDRRHPEMQMEDVEVEDQVLHPNFRRGDATPPQVIVTRSHGTRSDGHGNPRPLRRSVDQRGSAVDPRAAGGAAVNREAPGQRMPFPTSLDVDFLSLFAS